MENPFIKLVREDEEVVIEQTKEERLTGLHELRDQVQSGLDHNADPQSREQDVAKLQEIDGKIHQLEQEE